MGLFIDVEFLIFKGQNKLKLFKYLHTYVYEKRYTCITIFELNYQKGYFKRLKNIFSLINC